MKRLKKILCILGYIVYFAICFQCIFFSTLAYMLPSLSTRKEVIIALMVAIYIGIYFPGSLCIYYYWINRLYNKIDELEEEKRVLSCEAEFYKNRQRMY